MQHRNDAVPLDDPEPQSVGEICERMLRHHEVIKFLDREAPDWRRFNRRPPPYTAFVFGCRWWSEPELRAWIGK
jgi:hypothetical protein